MVGTEIIVSQGGASILLLPLSDFLAYALQLPPLFPLRHFSSLLHPKRSRSDKSKIMQILSKKTLNKTIYLVLKLSTDSQYVERTQGEGEGRKLGQGKRGTRRANMKQEKEAEGGQREAEGR
jgi:hypothetical protein